MWRSIAIATLSFPFSLLAFVIGWAARDLRAGLLAGAVVFTIFFAAAAVSLLLVRKFTYADAALPPAFAVIWSLVLAPFSIGVSLFSAPAFIAAGLMLGACMALAKRYATGLKWLLLPALVFLYEMLPLNLPGPVDDTFAVGSAAGAVLLQFLRAALPAIMAELAARRKAGG
ncbi:MAG: hypothetical protein M0011_11480 [Elusimicrobia bacterium]|nr:hypothetical protein [Elusimicrobiota bacterium]